jgi:hypothetical protein
MNKGGFSWKRALGITKAKRNISRTTGIPLTKSGRQRKLGAALMGVGTGYGVCYWIFIGWWLWMIVGVFYIYKWIFIGLFYGCKCLGISIYKLIKLIIKKPKQEEEVYKSNSNLEV